MMEIFQTIYYSRARVEVMDDPQSVLKSILETSSRNNARSEVTGALLYCAGTFLQVLEGPEDEVSKVLQRVSRDRRHYDLQVILSQTNLSRSFPRWSMCGAVLSPLDKEIVQTLSSTGRFSIDRLGATEAIGLLECVQRIQSKRNRSMRKVLHGPHFIDADTTVAET